MNLELFAQIHAIRSIQTDLKSRIEDLDDRILQVEQLTGAGFAEVTLEPVGPTIAPLPALLAAKLPPPPSPGREIRLREKELPIAPAARDCPAERPAPAAPKAEPHALEMRVGTYWLVRIGMLLLLTGLVFLGNYAWHAWVPRMGPEGKLAALALSGIALTLAGMLVHRGAAARESLRNYSLVLLGGGLATLYYTAYGAHFIESLRVIASPLAGGTLLLGVAVLIVWAAEKWRSETVALLAVLLSFYTAAMNPIAEFSLFSNLLLGGAAIWFLLRHDWAHLTYASLAGSYAAFGFWRVFQEGFVVWGTGLPESEFWTSRGFLLSYWVLFTAAFCLSGGRKLPARHRATAITANNAAFFAYSGPAFAQLYPGAFWILPGVFGLVLLVLSQLSRRRGEEPVIESTLLVQGLALVLLGMASRLTGYSLALCTAVEAALLLWMSGRDARQATVLRFGSAACCMVAALVSWGLLVRSEGQLPSLAVAAVFLFMAWLNRRQQRTPDGKPEAGAMILSLAALINVLTVVVQQNWNASGTTLALTSLAAATYGGWRRLRMPEDAVLSHLLILAATVPALHALDQFPRAAVDAWPMVIAGAGCLGVGLLWQHRKFPSETAPFYEWTFAAAGSAFLLGAWALQCSPVQWIAAGTGAAALWFVAGLALRSEAIGAWSQVALGSAVVFLLANIAPHPPASGWLVLAGVAACGFGAHAAMARSLFPTHWQLAVRWAGAAWRVVTAVLLAILIWPATDGFVPVVLVLQAAVWMLAGRRFNWPEATACSAVLASLWLLTGVLFGMHGRHTGAVILSSVLGLTILHAVARRWRDWLPAARVRHAVSAAAIVVLAAAVTGWVRREYGPEGFTAAWSVVGCGSFGLGLLLRDRAVRWTGLSVIGLALGRIFAVDVWQLSTPGRVISFLALGGVLLAIGFIYNRFADRIARWL